MKLKYFLFLFNFTTRGRYTLANEMVFGVYTIGKMLFPMLKAVFTFKALWGFQGAPVEDN